MQALHGVSRRITPPALPGGREQALPWYFRTAFIVLMFVTMPPFALPSVWFHPKMHVVWKLVITAAIIGFCWLSYIAIKGFIHQFDEETKMLNEMRL